MAEVMAACGWRPLRPGAGSGGSATRLADWLGIGVTFIPGQSHIAHGSDYGDTVSQRYPIGQVYCQSIRAGEASVDRFAEVVARVLLD